MGVLYGDELRKRKNGARLFVAVGGSVIGRVIRLSVRTVRGTYCSKRRDLKRTLPCSLNARASDGDIKKRADELREGSIASG